MMLEECKHDGKCEQMKLKAEYEALLQKIAEVRQRKFEFRMVTRDVSRCKSDWIDRRSSAERKKEGAIMGYKSSVMQIQAILVSLGAARKLCPTADSFYIWHRGPFGTINGLRLGSEAPSLPSSAASEEESVASSNTVDMPSMVFAGPVSSVDQGGSVAAGACTEILQVPWAEVNAALGMAALLLSTLEKKPHSCIKFHSYEIIPLGNYSKIGLLQPDGRPPVLYNLFYSDESFQFFGKRNFNTALDGLFHCLKDAADTAGSIDKAIVLPHKVEISSRSEVTIGGLPVAFGTDGDTWTRAMKYFLTDLKWLIAFTTKNADR